MKLVLEAATEKILAAYSKEPVHGLLLTGTTGVGLGSVAVDTLLASIGLQEFELTGLYWPNHAIHGVLHGMPPARCINQNPLSGWKTAVVAVNTQSVMTT